MDSTGGRAAWSVADSADSSAPGLRVGVVMEDLLGNMVAKRKNCFLFFIRFFLS